MYEEFPALCWLRCGGASMGGHASSVTSEDAKCERGRISKVRARCYLENHESYNFCYSIFCLISTVRRTSGRQKSGSRPRPRPRTVSFLPKRQTRRRHRCRWTRVPRSLQFRSSCLSSPRRRSSGRNAGCMFAGCDSSACK